MIYQNFLIIITIKKIDGQNDQSGDTFSHDFPFLVFSKKEIFDGQHNQLKNHFNKIFPLRKLFIFLVITIKGNYTTKNIEKYQKIPKKILKKFPHNLKALKTPKKSQKNSKKCQKISKMLEKYQKF